MDIYMVGVYKQRNKIVGFKMLDPNTADTSKQIMDVQYNQVIDVIKNKRANIVNLKLENGKLKGYNGSIDRYGVIGKSQALVILRKAVDDSDNLIGYICADCMGQMRLLSEKQVIDFANNIALANGKVITDNSGKSHVSAIEGTYQIYKKSNSNQPKQQLQEKTNKKVEVNGIDDETLQIISKLQTYKEYNYSYAKKVVTTIKKFNKCSEKQKECLKKILNEFESKQLCTNQQTQSTQGSEIKQTIKENKQDIKNNDINSMFEIEIMNNQLYIKRYKGKGINNLILPDSMEHNGKEYRVRGILSYAFANSDIEAIKTGVSIVDIGQSAFCNCKKLKYADLSTSNHPHIAMNCFMGCSSLYGIQIGSRVQRIHESAFKDCVGLKNIELPESTDTIARTAFYNCKSLKSVDSNVTTINDSAFKSCINLEQFNFSKVISIGAQAFRYTKFNKLRLPGNITTIGVKAFSDIPELTEVILEDGIESLGTYCFAKSDRDRAVNELKNRPYKQLDYILTCKSIKEIGAGAFRHAKIVKVYTGSVAESHCIGFDVPYERIDSSNLDNATRVRIKSELIDANPIKTLWRILNTPTENASNPDLELNENKLVDIPFNKQNFEFFNIEETTENIKPHVKFIGLLNYLQDVGDLYKDPLAEGVLRLQKTFNVTSNIIYNDGCNRAYKVIYSLVDTLEEGGFIMVIMNNHLRFVTKLTVATDVNMSDNLYTDANIPIKQYIHAGDKIGKTSTISGHNGVINIDGEDCNAGELLFNTISEHCMEIIPQRKDSIWYVPATGLTLKLHDKREWEKDNRSSDGKKIARNSEDCLNVIQVLNYNELIDLASTYKKHSIDSDKFFKQLNNMTQSEVTSRINMLSNVEEEKEAQLFHVSNEFRKRLQTKNIIAESASPNDLTIELLYDLSQSYWMIEKDIDWLRTTGQKSLSKTNEYIIDGYRLVEYKSNQIVKFSNPYMNGQKGAYVFTLMKNETTHGVYASRHSMDKIVKKLVELTQMKTDTTPIKLMQDPYNIDICSHDLFYNFYDVLYSKDGWKFKNYTLGYNRCVWNQTADFHIAMYKPTGIFYLTMEAYIKTPKGEAGRKTMPVLPIGNMDRALMIATTTNSKNKNSKLLEELMVLVTSVLMRTAGVTTKPHFKFNGEFDVDAYFEARKLAINGVKDINLYKKLINDRVVYMLGTVHKGVLQKEYDYKSDDDYDIEEFNDLEDVDDFDESEDEYDMEDFEESDDLDDYDMEEFDDTDEEDIMEDTSDIDSFISDENALKVQQQLKEAGHEISLSQIKIMMMEQLKSL